MELATSWGEPLHPELNLGHLGMNKMMFMLILIIGKMRVMMNYPVINIFTIIGKRKCVLVQFRSPPPPSSKPNRKTEFNIQFKVFVNDS